MYEDNIILPESHSIFSIKPDRLAGLFRLNTLQDPKLENALWNLLPIADELGSARSKELLYKIWDCLNDNIGTTSEFLKAIMYFTFDISDYFGPMFINSREPNIDNWLKCFDMIYEENPTFNFS